ncbi:MAG: tetratricopeptide repeat protein [Proteobacteria bacterium]|nr:tetratricopeptide repeat protein [Pseudomonadota bacterium]
MEAASLKDGFRVGDWLVEPRDSRASKNDQTFSLTDDQIEVLIVLASRHGEAVDHRTLRNAVWPGCHGSEEKLRQAVGALRELFGDKPRHPHYIASVGNDAYALIAHFEHLAPVAQAPDPLASGYTAQVTLGGRVEHLLVELRRRHVFKVTVSYLVGMWITLQVAEVTFEPLRFPEWWMTALTILAVIGLPIVVVLAWTYEITPEGVVLDAGVDGTGVMRRLPRPRQSIAPAIVAGVTLMAAVTGFAWWRSLDVPATTGATAAPPLEPGARSIAVLPLVDMSSGGGNAYLGDGLSEELSTKLAQIPGLRVAARTSAFEFKDKNLDVRKIGQSLGVRHVLEGSVRRNGDKVRVTVQLIDTATGYHVWAGNFDRAWRDVLALQDDIAVSVTDALQVVLKDDDARRGATQEHKLEARAIEPYLKGLAALRQPHDQSKQGEAQRAFEQAVAIDPEFAGAYAGLCRVHAREFDRTRDRSNLKLAEDACHKSLALNSSLVDTEKALAGLSLSDGDYVAAEAAYRKLLQVNSLDADSYIGLGTSLAGLGRGVEAETSFRQAVAVDPSYSQAYSSLAYYLFERGKIDEATSMLRKVTELVPASAIAWNSLGGALLMNGDFSKALDASSRSLLLEPSKSAYSNIATAYYYLGRFPEAVANAERAAAIGEHDYVIQGNLADALWQVPGRRIDAVAVYHDTIDLAERELEATPGNAALRAQLGYLYGRVGQDEKSRQYLETAAAAAPGIVYVQYFVAVAAADRGDRESALRAIAALVELGYSPLLLRSAPEFRSLLQDPEYKKVIESG